MTPFCCHNLWIDNTLSLGKFYIVLLRLLQKHVFSEQIFSSILIAQIISKNLSDISSQ